MYLIAMLIDHHVLAKYQRFYTNPGKFFNASLDKASEHNERNYYKISNSNGEDIIVVQIAGLLLEELFVKQNKIKT